MITNTSMAELIAIPTYTEDLSLTASFVITNATCGLCNGEIDLTTIGGQAPYTFEWSNGEITEDIEDLCLGFYTVTITDNTGCTFSMGNFLDNTNLIEVTLESQAEVNAFVLQYGDCEQILFTLRIGTIFSDPPSNISDISGLSNLTTIGGSLFIFQNPNLTSLSGLSGLNSIGSSIHINSNNALTTLSGLQGITELQGNLILDNHTNLLNLDGLDNLTTIGGDAYISNNTNLIDISGLSQLQSVNGKFDLRIALDLTNLSGLEQLETIGGDLILRDNFALTDISALDHPIVIEGDLEIENTGLSNCSILPVCTLLQNNATATINNNVTGCNTVEEIEMGCNSATLSVTEIVTHPDCTGFCNGVIQLIITGGVMPYDINWSNGSLFQVATNLCSGSYSVTVTDFIGASVEASYQIVDPEEVTITVDQITPTSINQNDGSIEISVIGGLGPFAFSWLLDDIEISTLKDPTGLGAGDYTLLTQDVNGCITMSGPFTVGIVSATSTPGKHLIHIFPNPVSDNITITFSNPGSENVDYSLWTANGIQLKSGTLSQTMENTLEVHDLSNGIYWLKIGMDNDFLIEKVVVSR